MPRQSLKELKGIRYHACIGIHALIHFANDALKNKQMNTMKRWKILVLAVSFFSFLLAAYTSATIGELKTVVIDPGHGGMDHGCNGHGKFEKVVALQLALKLGALIEANYPEVKVVYTRKTDVFLPLHERASIANQHKADLFISIHCNAFPKASAKAVGTETFVLGLHRAEENLEIMKRENEVILLEEDYEDFYDFDPFSPESHIVSSLFQNAFMQQSINFATKVEDQFVKVAKRKSRGVKQAGFAVLRKTTMPSVLIEAGFLTHPQEGEFIIQEEGQNLMATAIFNAFQMYKSEVESLQNVTATHEISSPTAVKVSQINKGESVKPTLKSPEFEFKVQLAATSKRQNTNFEPWNKVKTLEEEFNGTVYKYLSGGYTTYEAARLAKQNCEELGFKGAFVVVYQNGKRITLQSYQEQIVKRP